MIKKAGRAHDAFMADNDNERQEPGSEPGGQNAQNSGTNEQTTGKKNGTCPLCQKSVSAVYRPFCSKQCADIDLGRWLNQSYSIPVYENDWQEQDVLDSKNQPSLYEVDIDKDFSPKS